MPVVSVVMVSHRDTPFLRPAIASVLTQTFADLELILVDNGMNLTPASLGEVARDPRLKWVRLARNAGIPAGHNAGISAARSEFIALQDYDDVALPERLELQLAMLRADTGLGLVSSLAERIDAHGSRMAGRVFCLPNAAEHRAYAGFAAPLITPAAMARRDLLLALPYREMFPFAADIDFQSRLTDRHRTAVLPRILLRYRCYLAQTTWEKIEQIERSMAVIQLITMRRRANRPEGLEEVLRVAANVSLAEVRRRLARISREEGFFALSAYQARRLLVAERTPRGFMRATSLGLQAWRAAPRVERHSVASMFLQGPVRALGLHPVLVA